MRISDWSSDVCSSDLLRHGALEQITRDHSLLEEMIARGHYSREDAQRLVRKNIVTRALGVENEVQVDVIEDTVEVDDILLLCSDGLTDRVDDETIGLTLQRKIGRASLGERGCQYG